MAPSSDYTTAGGGLRLKGAKPSGVEKKKSKHKKKTADTKTQAEDKISGPAEKLDADTPVAGGSTKTEAERRHEEARRKRASLRGRIGLNERIKKEGNKTHKERVEELNRYLSGLSEHHDMPRIGPG